MPDAPGFDTWAALQSYERLRATLQQELGVEPGRETAVLADNIGRGYVAEERPGPSPAAGSGQTESSGRHLTLPLVGRADEHSRLAATFHRASRDGLQVVALIRIGLRELAVGRDAWAAFFH